MPGEQTRQNGPVQPVQLVTLKAIRLQPRQVENLARGVGLRLIRDAFPDA